MQSLRDPLGDAPPEDVRAWRPPILALAAAGGAKPARPDEATLARPLFLKSRRPFDEPAHPKAASAALAPPPGTSLRAVVRFGGKTRIFLVSPAFGAGRWFALGEKLDGWTIKDARQGGVTLRNGERSAKLEFDYDNVGKGDAPPPPAVEAPPPLVIRRSRG